MTVVGWGMVSAGLWLISPTAGLVGGGALLLAAVVLRVRR
jgi:hypothetical protein